MAVPQMSDDDHIDAADAILAILQHHEPMVSSAILLLAHAKLWADFGKGPAEAMITRYATDFVALVKLFKGDPLPPNQTLQ
jgi:hypothetical protein